MVPSRSPLAVQQGGPDQRSGVPGLGLGEGGRGRGGGHGGRDDQRRGPAERDALGHREDDEGDRGGDQQRAADVQPDPVFAAAWPRPRTAGDRAAASRPTGTLTRNTARQLVNCTSTPPSTWPATKPTDRDRAVEADSAGALGALGEAGGDQGQRSRGDEGGARALHDARGDQQHGVLGQAAGQAGQREGDQAGDEHAAPAEQVSGPAAEDQQAAERDGVSRHDPLDRIGGQAQFPLDRRQRHVHDAEIEDDHERGDEDQGQLQRLAAGRARGGRGVLRVLGCCCGGFGAVRRGGDGHDTNQIRYGSFRISL